MIVVLRSFSAVVCLWSFAWRVLCALRISIPERRVTTRLVVVAHVLRMSLVGLGYGTLRGSRDFTRSAATYIFIFVTNLNALSPRRRQHIRTTCHTRRARNDHTTQ